MRCLACNKILNDYEATRKYSFGEYVDLCSICFTDLDIDAIAREDLCNEEDVMLPEDNDIYLEIGEDNEI